MNKQQRNILFVLKRLRTTGFILFPLVGTAFSFLASIAKNNFGSPWDPMTDIKFSLFGIYIGLAISFANLGGINLLIYYYKKEEED